MSIKTVAVAVERVDDGVSILRLVSEAPLSSFDIETATQHGFTISKDGRYVREITDQIIEKEIKFSNSGWIRIEEDDIPKDRKVRANLKNLTELTSTKKETK